MSYDEHDAAMDAFYERMSDELYPEHKEQAIDEFIEERMHSFYLKNSNIIQPPIDCYHHANELMDVSTSCALIMYTTAIELFLKSVLLKPVLYGMIHNEHIANMIVDISTNQTGFSRYSKLLSALCLFAAGTKLSDIEGMTKKPILIEAEEVQRIRNRVIHQGYVATSNEMKMAKNNAHLILLDVVEPVLNNMNLVIGTNNGSYSIIKEKQDDKT
jgi:hypothetical protein